MTNSTTPAGNAAHNTSTEHSTSTHEHHKGLLQKVGDEIHKLEKIVHDAAIREHGPTAAEIADPATGANLPFTQFGLAAFHHI